MKRRGFTLVEIMIVVAIIGIIAAVAIPNFVRSRETALRSACIQNMTQIYGAVQLWTITTGASTDSTPGIDDLVTDYIKAWPKCGTSSYEVPAVDVMPVCPDIDSHPDHHK